MSSLGLAMPAKTRGAPTMRTLWLILAAVVIADALDLMDSTLTNIAAPTIAANLGGGELLIKWLGSAYALALGSLLVIGGRLGDRFGQRRTFLIGMTGFTLASALCGLAPSPAVLVGGRLSREASGRC
jgi:MFS family permease